MLKDQLKYFVKFVSGTSLLKMKCFTQTAELVLNACFSPGQPAGAMIPRWLPIGRLCWENQTWVCVLVLWSLACCHMCKRNMALNFLMAKVNLLWIWRFL